jgi:hypothetical protein
MKKIEWAFTYFKNFFIFPSKFLPCAKEPNEIPLVAQSNPDSSPPSTGPLSSPDRGLSPPRRPCRCLPLAQVPRPAEIDPSASGIGPNSLPGKEEPYLVDLPNLLASFLVHAPLCASYVRFSDSWTNQLIDRLASSLSSNVLLAILPVSVRSVSTELIVVHQSPGVMFSQNWSCFVVIRCYWMVRACFSLAEAFRFSDLINDENIFSLGCPSNTTIDYLLVGAFGIDLWDRKNNNAFLQNSQSHHVNLPPYPKNDYSYTIANMNLNWAKVKSYMTFNWSGKCHQFFPWYYKLCFPCI